MYHEESATLHKPRYGSKCCTFSSIRANVREVEANLVDDEQQVVVLHLTAPSVGVSPGQMSVFTH